MNCLVILDPGHGLNTPGKRTPKFSDSTFMRENEFNREVVIKVYKLLEENENIDVVFTTTEKRDIPLIERVERVNMLYDRVRNLYDKIVVVSVHANAMKNYWNDIGSGTATFHYPNNETDKKFAEVIQKNLITKTKLNSHRGGVVAGDFYIIRAVKCTACLVECAFMDNQTEAKLLRTDEFRQACSEGIVNGLLEYFGINEVRYKKYSDSIHELRGEIKDFNVRVVNKSNTNIQDNNCTNGTFFWHTDIQGIKYPTSILYANGRLYKATANHLPYPQSCFIKYKDNTVEMKRIKNITELNLDKIELVIGGVGIRNTLENFRYSPAAEGFKGVYADVLRKSNKTLIGYNKRLDKVYLLALKNVTMTDVIRIISDNSTGEAYDICLMVDGGGSSCMYYNGENILKGDGRIIHNILCFN